MKYQLSSKKILENIAKYKQKLAKDNENTLQSLNVEVVLTNQLSKFSENNTDFMFNKDKRKLNSRQPKIIIQKALKLPSILTPTSKPDPFSSRSTDQKRAISENRLKNEVRLLNNYSFATKKPDMTEKTFNKLPSIK